MPLDCPIIAATARFATTSFSEHMVENSGLHSSAGFIIAWPIRWVRYPTVCAEAVVVSYATFA